MAGVEMAVSHMELFKKFSIPPEASEFRPSLLSAVDTMEEFQSHSD
jgi:hypothetical protein